MGISGVLLTPVRDQEVGLSLDGFITLVRRDQLLHLNNLTYSSWQLSIPNFSMYNSLSQFVLSLLKKFKVAPYDKTGNLIGFLDSS